MLLLLLGVDVSGAESLDNTLSFVALICLNLNNVLLSSGSH